MARYEELTVNELTLNKMVAGSDVGSTSTIRFKFPAGFLGKVIETGTFQSTADGGVTLTSDNDRPNSFLADDSGANIAASVRNVLARTLLTYDQSGGSIRSVMGQLKMISGVDLGTGVYTGVQGYLEWVASNSVDAGGKVSAIDASIEVADGATLTVDASGLLAGVKIELTAGGGGTATVTQTGDCAALWIDTAGTITDWKVGIDINDITTGIDIGACTTGINISGANTTGILFGSYTPDSGGSSGAALLRAGTYTVPLTESTNYQGGIFRMYLETSGVSSYNKGAFICLKTTGAKGIHGVCSLVEVLAQSVAGPTSVYAGQFVAHLNSATAKIASSGALPELVGIWTKITSEVGSTIAASTVACALWVDNQLNGTVSGEEYGIFATCGGSKVDAFIGFETTSSGWTNLFYFDETAYDQDPVGTATVSGGTADKYLKVSLNGTAYGIQLYAI